MFMMSVLIDEVSILVVLAVIEYCTKIKIQHFRMIEERRNQFSNPGVPEVWSRGPINHTKSGTIVVTKCNIRRKNHYTSMKVLKPVLQEPLL